MIHNDHTVVLFLFSEIAVEIFTVQYVTTSMESSTVLRAVDIQIESSTIITAFESASIVTATGVAFTAVDITTVSTVQEQSLFGCIHSEVVQESDIVAITTAVQTSFATTMSCK